METQEPRSGMREASYATTDTINSRIKRYKILVISVAVVTLGSLIWSIIRMSWFPLLVLILNVPICGAFLISESLVLNRWQKKIFELWTNDLLDLSVYYDTMASIRMFPQNTLRSMLATLPEGKLADKSPKKIKESLAMTLKTINQCQIDRTVLNTIAITIILLSLVYALIIRSFIPLLSLLFIIVAPVAGLYLNSARLRKLKRKITNVQQHQENDIAKFNEIADKLDWRAIRSIKGKLIS